MVKNQKELLKENLELKARLKKTQATLRAIQTGKIDAPGLNTNQSKKVNSQNKVDKPYRLIIENMNESALLISPENIILFCNTAFARLMNLSSNKIVGSSLYEFISHESINDYNKIIKKSNKAKSKGNINFKSKDIKNIPLEIVVEKFSENGNKFYSLMAYDVTGLSESEENLRVSQADLKEAHRLIRMGTWELNLKTKKVKWSEELFEITGRKKNLSIPKFSELSKQYSPESLTIRENAINRCIELGINQKFVAEFRRFDNHEKVWVETICKPLKDEKGKVVRIFGTTKDITEQKNAELLAENYQIELEKKVKERTSELLLSNEALNNEMAERKKLMDTLHESEQRLKYHFENSPLAVVEWDRDYIVTQWSKEAEKIFGWKKKETIGKRIETLNMIYEEDIPIVNKTMERLSSGKENIVVSTNRNYTKSGEVINCTWYNSILVDDNGEMNSVMSLVEDITERTLASEVLKESEERYRSLFESMSEGYAFCKMQYDGEKPVDFAYLKVNKAFEKLTGLKNVEGKKVSEVIPGIQDSDDELFKIYGRVAKNGKPEKFEIFVEALKEWFHVSVYCPMKEYFIAIFEVITERKKAEEAIRQSQIETLNEKNRLEIVMDTMPIGMSILDEKGGIIKSNKNFNKVWGKKPTETKSIEDYKEFKAWHLDTNELVKPEEWAAAKAIEKGKTVIGQVFRIQKFDGTTGYVHNSASPIKDADGKVTGCVVAIQDTTDYMKKEEALLESESKLSSLYSSMTEGVALHELIYDNDGKPIDYYISDVNPAYEKILGLKKENVIGKRASELYGTGEPPYFDIYRKVVETGIPESFEVYFEPLKIHFSIAVFSPGKNKFATVFSNITERKRAEETLRESEAKQKVTEAIKNEKERFNEVLNKLPAYVTLLSKDYQVSFANRLFEERFGSPNGNRCYEYFHNRTEPCEVCETFKVFQTKAPHFWEWTGPDGRDYQSSGFPFTDSDGSDLVMEVGLDITDKKNAEAKSNQERQRFNELLDMMPAYVVLLSPDYHVPFANRFFEERFGKSNGKKCYEYLFNLTEPCENCETFKVLNTNKPHHWEWTGPDGRNYDISDFPFTDSDGSTLIMEVGIDITERKLAESKLKEERQRLNEVLEELPAMVCLLTEDYHLTFANKLFRERRGMSHEKLCYEVVCHRSTPCPECQTYTVFNTNAPHHWEWTSVDGKFYDVYAYPFTEPDGTKLILEMSIDVTERKRAELRLHQTNRALRTITACNQIQIHSTTEEQLLNDICKVIVLDGDYKMAWVGYKENDEEKSVRPVGYYGFEEGYLEKANIRWSDETELGKGPTGTAIRTGNISKCRNMLTDPKFKPWREEAIKRGYASSIVIPLKSNGDILGALSIYAIESDAFDANEETLLKELTDDLAFSIKAIRDRNERQIAEEKLRSVSQYTRSLIEASLDPLVTISEEGKITDVNEATEKATGLMRESLIGTDFCDYFTEPDKAREGYKKVLEEGIVLDYPLTVKNNTGSTIEVLYNAALYKNSKGEIEGVFAAARDITQMKRAEQTAREIYNLYRVLFDNMEDGLLLTEPEGHIYDANPAASRITGFSREEIIEKGRNGIFDENDPNLKIFLEKRLKEGHSTGEVTLKCKDGTIKPIEVSSKIFQNENGEIFTSLIFRDISERKRTEKELIHLASFPLFNPNPIIEVNMQMEVTMCNESIKKIIKELNLKDESAFYPEDFREIMKTLGPENMGPVLREIKIKDRYFEVSIRYATGYEGVRIYGRDITDYKIAEIKIKESEASLIEAQKLAKIGNWSWSLATGELKWSDEMFQITGRDKNSPVPNFEESKNYYTPESLAVRNETVKRSIDEGVAASFEAEMIRYNDNVHVWIKSIIKVEKDISGKVIKLFGTAQDITEVKKAEVELKKLSDGILDLYNNAPCGYHSIDKNGIFVNINNTELLWLGYKREEVVNKLNIKDVITPEDMEDFKINFPKLINEGHLENLELEFIRKNGTRFYASINATAVYDDSGNFKYSRTTLFDVTERKNIEQQLGKSLKNWTDTFSAINDRICLLGKDGTILQCNKSMSDMLGVESSQIVGHKCFELMHSTHTFIHDCPFAAMCKTKKREVSELILNGKHYAVSADPIYNEAGELDGAVHIIRDITERKLAELAIRKSEAELKKAQHIGRFGNWLWDAATDTLTISDLLYEIFDYDKKTPVPGYGKIIDLFEEESGTVLNKAIQESMETGKTFELDLELKHIDGKQVKWVTIRGEVLNDENNKPFGLHGTVQDITIRKQMEEQLRELAHKIQSVREEERTTLSRTLHDYFGQSLTGLKMGISLLEKKYGAPDTTNGDSELIERLKSMKTTVDELAITTSRLSMELRPNVLDMLGLLPAVEWVMEDFTKKSGIKHKTKCLIESIDISPQYSTEVFRIMQEILTNIIRHAEATQVNVKVFSDINNYVIEVEDNGKGITTDNINSGYSFGIMGMKERAMIFGGTIEIYSAKKRGTVVMIKIPLSENKK